MTVKEASFDDFKQYERWLSSLEPSLVILKLHSYIDNEVSQLLISRGIVDIPWQHSKKLKLLVSKRILGKYEIQPYIVLNDIRNSIAHSVDYDPSPDLWIKIHESMSEEQRAFVLLRPIEDETNFGRLRHYLIGLEVIMIGHRIAPQISTIISNIPAILEATRKAFSKVRAFLNGLNNIDI